MVPLFTFGNWGFAFGSAHWQVLHWASAHWGGASWGTTYWHLIPFWPPPCHPNAPAGRLGYPSASPHRHRFVPLPELVDPGTFEGLHDRIMVDRSIPKSKLEQPSAVLV